MKRFVLFSALLCAAPAFAADSPIAVRQYVANRGTTDWQFGGGWGWSDGVLTHYPGATGVVEQVAPAPTEPGRHYRIRLTFSNHSRGSITVGFGATVATYRQDGTFFIDATAKTAADGLRLSATQDYDGSVSRLELVELGPELTDATKWTVPAGWSANADGTFTDEAGSPVQLEQAIAAQPGHHYAVSFSIKAAAPAQDEKASVAKLNVSGTKGGWFYEQGTWNYLFDVIADADGRIGFQPTGEGRFTGSVTNVSIREITSDAPTPRPAATGSN